MRLSRLGVVGFRNLRDATMAVPLEGVAILGANAQGKTNLLEAIHYLEIFRSFRGVPDRQLVRFGEEGFRVSADLAPETPTGGEEEGTPDHGEAAKDSVAVVFRRDGGSKRVTLGGQPVERLADAIGSVGSVLFTPDDVRLVSDGPAERRRYLDILLSLNVSGYLDALQRFRHGLSQRNSALREGRPEREVRIWDEAIIGPGAQVMWTRAVWIRDRAQAFRSYYREISGGESARIHYAPGISGTAEWADRSAAAEDFRRSLRRTADRERSTGATVVGPQRDELRFFAESPHRSRDVRAYGSGGERRTAALALRLLEADTVRVGRGTEPILLLDDVFGELDEGRAGRVLELLERSVPGQVLITAPRESDLRLRREVLPRWFLRDGEVTV